MLTQGSVAKAILSVSAVAATGLTLGSLGIHGIRLGAAGVLFAGIFLDQLGMVYAVAYPFGIVGIILTML